MTYAVTTPFGRRPLKLAHVAAQMAARQRPPEAAVHKWTVFRALCAARRRLGLSERTLAVLDALLSFHPETVLSGDNLVVFPSNAQLSLRAHGMAASTLRRHLAALVDAGLVLRRDSANGKRFARKGRDGAIDEAFGFDLAPLAARAAEFEALAEEIRAEQRALAYAKERITLARRDLVKAIAAGLEQDVAIAAAPGRPASWVGYHALCRELVARIPQAAGLPALEALAGEFSALADEVLKLLEDWVKATKASANESQIERHLQTSNSQVLIDLEPACEQTRQATEIATVPKRRAPLPLGLVLQACPDIADYARGGVANWRDLGAAAGVARAALGVSPSAYAAATAALGPTDAAIAVAAILQRGAAIRNAGGYLRELARKAEAGEFSVGPMLMALVAARRGQQGRAAARGAGAIAAGAIPALAG
jgi:replication initiation protein RepC